MGETKRGCLLTCKCPWYILSTQSVADLSVSGSSDFFQTCEADCQTWKCAHQTAVLGAASDGRSRAELSSPQVLKPTLCAHPAFMCAVTPRRAGRRRSATSDLTFYLPLHSVLTLACDRDRFGVCFFFFFLSFFFFLKKRRQPRGPCGNKNHRFILDASPCLSFTALRLPLLLSPVWFKCFDAPRGSVSSYSALLFSCLPTTPCDPALRCLLQC